MIGDLSSGSQEPSCPLSPRRMRVFLTPSPGPQEPSCPPMTQEDGVSRDSRRLTSLLFHITRVTRHVSGHVIVITVLTPHMYLDDMLLMYSTAWAQCGMKLV